MSQKKAFFTLKKVSMLDGCPCYVNTTTDKLTLYHQIKKGIKLSEWREAKHYWFSRLCNEPTKLQKDLNNLVIAHRHEGLELPLLIDLTDKLKVDKAWFTEGNPKGNVPRIETNIKGLFYHPRSNLLEIKIMNPVEVTK